ncbi:hypothetical protein BDV24DRAFT_175485 [Aspergillus arachidicola]|uniref:non-specific serine/threonine protein kinase n=1 Tax=Aspergillus arachidicola TaxID=656916 RepID=A0A5N6Y413_9EURO|nr:hypothetical protein BDV24DRAFT_175485 [Aspergillus arachidicola]
MRRFERIYDVVEPVEEYRRGGYHPVHLHDIFNDRYEVRAKLAFGQFSTVWLASDQLRQQQVALKILKADASKDSKGLSILLHLSDSDLQHPGKNHLMQLLDHFEHHGPNGTHLCLVLPVMVSDGEAMTITGRPHYAAYVQEVSRQILLGLDFLHRSGIIHCAAFIRQREQRPVTPTALRAPELIHRMEWGVGIDIWTLGCLNLPPPPPPPPLIGKTAPKPRSVASEGPAGAYLVELLIFNGRPFKDHWAYWVRSHSSPDIGVQLHATGDVRNGFVFQIKRNYDFHDENSECPSTRIPLQWIDGKFFDERAMMNNGVFKLDDVPVCGFEASVYKVKAPEKSLNTVTETAIAEGQKGQKVNQRNCQTWIVESADQLVRDGIFNQEVATYLHAIEQ